MSLGHRWDVTVATEPFSIHHWAVWGGLVELDRQGVIRLRHRPINTPPGGGLWLVAHDRERHDQRSIWVDTSDRAPEVSQRRTTADVEWVRNARTPTGLPLGFVAPLRPHNARPLTYAIGAAISDLRHLSGRGRSLRATVWCSRAGRLPPTYEEIETPPTGLAAVMLQVRCWEPDEGGDPEDRVRVNDSRAALIRELRNEFGSRFVGGFQSRPYARNTYPDCVADMPFDQRSYLETLRKCAVAVAGTGLHGSLPWKLAEYAAMSRAVVAERNENAVPDSHRGVYAVYESIRDCVDRCADLLSDASLRKERQEASGRLWREHVRPDRLVLERLHETFD